LDSVVHVRARSREPNEALLTSGSGSGVGR